MRTRVWVWVWPPDEDRGDPIEGHDVFDYGQFVIFDDAFMAGVDSVGFEVLLGVVADVEDVSEVEQSGFDVRLCLIKIQLAWGGFAGFNLLEMGFSEFEIFWFRLVVLYFWIDLVLWGFRIWWFCWVWENGHFKIFNFWILIYGFVFLLFLFKTHFDFN